MGTMEKFDETKHEVERKAHEVERKAGDVLSMLIRGAEAAAGVGSLVHYFNARRMSSWMPFQRRRRTVLGTIGLVGAGAAAGACLYMFLSPMSGREMRRRIARGLQEVGRKGKEAIETAEEEISELAKGGEEGKQQYGSMKGEQRGETGQGKAEQREGKAEQREGKAEQRSGGNAVGTMGTPGRHA